MSRRRLASFAALAFIAALATALVLSNRADAQQALTSGISVSPANAVNQAGTVHTMGVTVSPVQSGVQIRYQILSGPNGGDIAALDTNANGLVVLSYTGDGGVGTDAILIWADLDRDGVRDNGEPLTTAIVEWVGAASTTIQLTPASSSGQLGASHTVIATLAPVRGSVRVRFQVTSGPNVGDAGATVTNSSGQASFTYTGDGGLGTDTIVAWPDLDGNGARDGNEPQATATRGWASTSTNGVTVEPASTTRVIGQAHSVNATLAPAQSGLFMRFEVNSGPNTGGRGIALTDADGRATYTYVGRGAGTDVITAWIDLDRDGTLDTGEPRGQANVTWTATGSTTRTLSASPTSDSGPVGASRTVTATVSPAVASLVVRFRVVSGPHLGTNGRTLTNTAGQASYSYQGNAPGTDSIRVWLDINDDGALDSGEPRTFVSKNWTGAASARSLTLQPGDNVALIGTTHSLTAAVSPVQSGLVVRFLVSAGPNRGDAGVAVTDSQGRATFNYLGNGGVGNDAIVSWIDLNNNGARETNESQASAVQRWVTNQATGISASPGSSSGAVGAQHSVTATVSPIASGVLVRFRVTQGPNLGVSGVAQTDSQGRAGFSYTGTGGVGSDLILVWADANGNGSLDANEPRTSAIRSWTTVAGSSFSLSPSSDTNPVNSRHSMTATFAPAQSGLLVRFEVISGPNAGTRGSDDTNSSGRADLSYVGSGGVGADTIRAWVDFDRDGLLDSGEPQTTATKQWTAVTVSGLSLTPEFDQRSVGKKHKLTARLNPALEGVLIRFEILSGPSQGERLRDRTNDDGKASVDYRGNGGAGTDLILAWADLDEDGILDHGERQATARVEWRSEQVSSSSARVNEICKNLDRYTHPSLPTLCRLIKDGKLSGQSEQAIMDVILKNAEKTRRPSRDDDDRGRGNNKQDDDDDDHDDDD